MERQSPKRINNRWPEGKEAHNIDAERLECPICFSKLMPCEALYLHSGYELWSFHCLHCHTEYLCDVPENSITIPISLSAYVKQLEEKIRDLEKLLQSRPSNIPISDNQHEENIKSKYAFLLK